LGSFYRAAAITAEWMYTLTYLFMYEKLAIDGRPQNLKRIYAGAAALINIYDRSILPFVFIAIMIVIYYFPAACWYLTKYNP